MMRTLRRRPHTVYVPERYWEAFAFICQALDDERALVPSKQGMDLPGPPTAIDVTVFGSSGVARMTVREAGEGFPRVFGEGERSALRKEEVALQVVLKLSCPWVGTTVEYLGDRDYFFGGPFVRWFGEDRFLMQKTLTSPRWEGIMLCSDRAVKIMEYVRADRERVRR